MLKDLKSFVVGSNVAEVGVGLSIGAAFTALVTAVVDFAKDGIKGEWAYAGISAAGIALVTIVLVSMVGVVKPLMKLRARTVGSEATAAEAEPVAEAAQAEVAEVTDADAAAETDEPVVAVARGEAVAAEPVDRETAVEAAAFAGAEFAADPLHAPIPVQVARSAMSTGPASVVLGATALGSVAATTATAEAQTPTEVGPAEARAEDAPAEAAVVEPTVAGEAPAEAVPAEAAVVDLTAAAAPAAPVVPAGAVPFRATELTACPHCAFDVPATATRCGWCTSDLRVVVTA